MDYGPFGFIERYDPMWNMWSGGGEKYSFRHQYRAGERNFFSLASSLMLLLRKSESIEVANGYIRNHMKLAENCIRDVFQQKLGFMIWNEYQHNDLLAKIEYIMKESEADYVMFWRQLCSYPTQFLQDIFMSYVNEYTDRSDNRNNGNSNLFNPDVYGKDESFLLQMYNNDLIFEPMMHIFYRDITASHKAMWVQLLRKYLYLLFQDLISAHQQQVRIQQNGLPSCSSLLVLANTASGVNLDVVKDTSKVEEVDTVSSTVTMMNSRNEVLLTPHHVSMKMKQCSPKYVPREWMLMHAYREAEQGRYDSLYELERLFQFPYGEQMQYEVRYYRKKEKDDLDRGGVDCMT